MTDPYYGWSYATDGKLVGVPSFKEAYHDKLDKARWGLVEVPSCVAIKAPSGPPGTRRHRRFWSAWGSSGAT
jgi:hypothetical protein